MKSYRSGPATERIEHRAFTLDDCESFYHLNSHPEVMRYTGEPPLRSLMDARRAIADYPDFETVGFGRWACVLKDTGAVIGFCGLKYLPELEEVDVGFRFFPEYWGQGIATETCSACIAFGFEVLKLDRILGLVLTENKASIRVLEKCGLTQNGEVTYDGERALKYEIIRAARGGA
ncbi:MAG: GNAT family N-acetyltransferase [Phycisphaerae bacterium]|nr:GNAT family N-acetyltransferase [Phycisphaerae bacterium]MBM92436.1 GNAT family N-acetyltransferase [Phycisphaerae bacterium]HCT45802.1 N-acetyltransferase [Phycisphaerales bacterium]